MDHPRDVKFLLPRELGQGGPRPLNYLVGAKSHSIESPTNQYTVYLLYTQHRCHDVHYFLSCTVFLENESHDMFHVRNITQMCLST